MVRYKTDPRIFPVHLNAAPATNRRGRHQYDCCSRKMCYDDHDGDNNAATQPTHCGRFGIDAAHQAIHAISKSEHHRPLLPSSTVRPATVVRTAISLLFKQSLSVNLLRTKKRARDLLAKKSVHCNGRKIIWYTPILKHGSEPTTTSLPLFEHGTPFRNSS